MPVIVLPQLRGLSSGYWVQLELIPLKRNGQAPTSEWNWKASLLESTFQVIYNISGHIHTIFQVMRWQCSIRPLAYLIPDALHRTCLLHS